MALADYHTDHLFLLMGGNPLPNYVAARLLTRPESYYYLLASPGTLSVAKRIKSKLIEESVSHTKLKIIPLDDPSDARHIIDKLHSYLKISSIESGHSVGLNYTGATKPMSVHTHETLQKWCPKNECNYIYSYLDPRRLCFCFADGVTSFIKPSDCQLSLKELVELHGWQIEKANDTPDLPDLCRHLASELNNKEKLIDWRQWCDWNLRTWSGRNGWRKKDWPGFQASGRAPGLVTWVTVDQNHESAIQELLQWVQNSHRKRKKSELTGVKLHSSIPTDATSLAEFRDELAPETGWADNNDGFDKLCAFLDGAWLENYVLMCIQSVMSRCGVHDAQQGIEIMRTGKYKAKFEFDVAAMKGYRLFALSCTTSTNRGQNKKRLFEAYTRARQMGGDEARVALVGGYRETRSLLQEVNEAWLAPQDMIRVFGSADWPRLENKLEQWFN